MCVPSPYEEGKEYDMSYIEDVVAKIPDGKIVVLKSTVNPGATDDLQARYPNKIFMFNPEFLSEATAWEDFEKPHFQILGVPVQGYAMASEIMGMLPIAPIMKIVSPIDAEWIKKATNWYYALKVIYFNELYDLVGVTQGDYETVRNTLVENPWIGNSHSMIFHKGMRGFGGKCLPKDSYSLICFSEKNGLYAELLKTMKKINLKLNQGLK